MACIATLQFFRKSWIVFSGHATVTREVSSFKKGIPFNKHHNSNGNSNGPQCNKAQWAEVTFKREERAGKGWGENNYAMSLNVS